MQWPAKIGDAEQDGMQGVLRKLSIVFFAKAFAKEQTMEAKNAGTRSLCFGEPLAQLSRSLNVSNDNLVHSDSIFTGPACDGENWVQFGAIYKMHLATAVGLNTGVDTRFRTGKIFRF